MPTIELPHTQGCLVCGRSNPHGLSLSLHVDPESGKVHTTFIPKPHHIGFQGIVHGGVLATIMDEAMVWAATWSGKRFCVCGEMTVRFRTARIDVSLLIEARVESSRSRVIQASAEIKQEDGLLIGTGTGKFVTVAEEQHQAFVKTLVDDATTNAAANFLRSASQPQ